MLVKMQIPGSQPPESEALGVGPRISVSVPVRTSEHSFYGVCRVVGKQISQTLIAKAAVHVIPNPAYVGAGCMSFVLLKFLARERVLY